MSPAAADDERRAPDVAQPRSQIAAEAHTELGGTGVSQGPSEACDLDLRQAAARGAVFIFGCPVEPEV
jgi:hypothetical protein